MRRSMLSVGAALILAMTLGTATARANAPSPKSEAEISAAFGADCTDFSASSSKDISYVEVHFGDGRVVKDESTTSPGYSYDGADAIAAVVIKSGTTVQTLTCQVGEPDHGQD